MVNRFTLHDKVAIVTGASEGGIGESYAKALADEGAAVVCADINGSGAKSAARSIGGRVVATTVDIADVESVTSMVQAAHDAFGGVDILVNNAALMEQIVFERLQTISLERWNQILSVNVTGAMLCSQAVVPSMAARGGGVIVNQSSGGAWATPSIYGITKLAIVALTQALAHELAPQKIRVNAIAPGMTESSAGQRLVPVDSPIREMFQAQAPLRPFGTPDELSGALLLLTSEAGRWMTGQTLNVDGGWVMRT